MEKVRISNFYLLAFTLVLFASALVLPTSTSALEVSSRTQQILPIGGSNACTQLPVTSFTPYIYDGALHSFEFTVPDASYVAVLGSVGDSSLSFDRLTRRVDASGSVLIHADIETTPIRGTLPLQVTLLSARTGQPVCLATIYATVGSGPVQSASVSPAIAPAKPKSAVPSTSSTPVKQPIVVSTSSSPSKEEKATDAPTTTPVLNTIQSKLNNLCASEASAYRLWLILLVLFALMTGALLWAEFPLSLPWARTPERIATIVLALLLILLGFWYFSAACRAALWMPLVAFLIAILGLLAAFWNHPRVTQLLLIQDSKK